MPSGRGFLERLRPVGTPGAAARRGVPADRIAEFGAELEPLFELLTEVDAEAARIRLTAEEDARRIVADGRARAEAVVADATVRAEAARAAAAASGRDEAANEEALLLRQAGEEVTRLRGRAADGYLYSDLASLYERCGRVRGTAGSVTVLPVLTMPGGDIGHPVPDLTGYITEGQVVLSAEAHARGVYPPVDPLSSLSRLMRKGAGPGRTRADHLPLANQLVAALARARQVRELGDMIGAAALSDTDRRYLDFDDAFCAEFAGQRRNELRKLDDTLDRVWRVLLRLPPQ